jgi:hypothetical protein
MIAHINRRETITLLGGAAGAEGRLRGNGLKGSGRAISAS